MSYALHEETIKLVKEERRLTGLVIENIQKISDQRLYLKMGYSSLFEYCTKGLQYSESCAYRRISAVRVVKEIPDLKDKLNQGTINLTNLSIAQSFFAKKPASTETKKEILALIENCSKREAESVLVRWAPEVAIQKQESVRIVSVNEASLQILIKKETLTKLDRLKNIRSHKNPKMNYAELIEDMCDYLLKRLDPLQRKASSPKKCYTESNCNLSVDNSQKLLAKKQTRYISSTTKVAVYRRDQNQCTYLDANTGKRCSSQHLLQLDHIQPYRHQGDNSATNLRLLCHAHHQLRD